MTERHFHLLAKDFDLDPLKAEIERYPIGFTENGEPTDHGDIRAAAGTRMCYFVMEHVVAQPHRVEALRVVEQTRSRLGGPQIRWASLLAMPPRSVMAPHRDDFPYDLSRTHLAIENAAAFTIGQQSETFAPGELWLSDIANRWHHVVNDTDVPRVMLITDFRMLPAETLYRFAGRATPSSLPEAGSNSPRLI